ncbi:MAG TPA: bifunctional SDR family oxidoreductase/aminotransferase class I/II-fold pyridoxal phosphate-dependent enzyme [Candidatus Hydrogenedentes bacterium]|nr:bifunctional SDR family oxidoreductase/aminotransferase class I/II-fold pyridoxal phosphate-dependent enzyme [Candidatus Hydrogenedentota bacterium]HPG68705.1 bifunctional SDR family oxidoreductase/aminotransferase class I/II-fold pyridoxal phosphate-dependent enzyme [Candidatus Hydrogenedentota bacterium]
MQVLVTGGGGYMGCHLVPLLLKKGHSVRVFDRFCFGEDVARRAFGESPDCEVVRGDIRNLDMYPALLDGVEGIIHLAGLSNDPSCDLDEETALDVNLVGARSLAQRAVEKGVRRFVLASSCSVYGKGVFDILDEESPTHPVSVYGVSKRETERAILPLQSPTFEPVAARPATLFGWSPRMRFDLAINLMTATACRKGRITVMGGGRQWRPFLHVQDAARAFLLLLESPADRVSGQVFNVGFDDANFQIVDLARKVLGYFDGVELEMAGDDEDVRSYNVRFDKIRDLLGFRQRFTVDDGIVETRDALVADRTINPWSDQYCNVRRMKVLIDTPVDEGGEPVAPRFIALAKPTIGDEEVRAVEETLRSGWMATGAKVEAFERAFAQRVGVPYAVAVNSCTAALHLCLTDAGVQPGDEVITPPITWASTANTIVSMGARPVFADISRDTLDIDPAAVERAITDRTKAIIPVDLAGQPCDLDAIYTIAAERGIAVIEDAAHALGAAYKGVPLGRYGNGACFSFYPIKNITTIEGGMITAVSEDRANRLRLLASNGMQRTAWDRYSPNAVPGPVEVVTLGFKYRMHDVSAVMGLEQLKKLDRFLAIRKRLAQNYRTVLEDIDEVSFPAVRNDVEHAWHLMIIRLDLARLTKSRDEIALELRKENVGTGIHFYGLHLHRYYRETFDLKPEDFPEATAASREILSLPLHPGMSDKHVHQVVAALKKVLAHARKAK